MSDRDAVLRVHTRDELVADTLWILGALAVTEEDGSLLAGFASEADVAAALAALGDRWPAERVAVDDFGDAWRAYAKPVTVGPLTITPAWLAGDGDGDGDGDEITIEPGRAFGIGDHATTRLALQALVDLGVRGATVLDVGTGTGVLALAAARLGARAVTAIDVDEHAVVVAQANVVANAADGVVTVATTPLDQLVGTFDIVVANLGGLELPITVAPALASKTGGLLVVSGLLDPATTGPDVAPLDDALADAGLVHDRDWRGDGWLARSWIVSRAGTRARRGRGSPAPSA